MSVGWYVARRLVWTVLAAYLVLSGSFFVFAFTPDPNENLVAFGAGVGAAMEGGNTSEAQQEAVAAYRQARDRDRPVMARYVDWMVGYATLDWGMSYPFFADREPMPVTAVIAQTGRVTLVYLLPAILLAILGGIAIGLYSATHEHTLLDYLGTSLSYFGIGLPNFWLAEVLVLIALNEFEIFGVQEWDPGGPLAPGNLPLMVIAGVVVGTNLLAVQVRYARSESKEYVPAEFVKTIRSTGASGWQVARHVLRNAAIPLVSLLFTELLIVLMINVFVVEAVLGIPGIGDAAFQAIEDRDVGLILGTTLLVVLITLLGNLFQDVAYTVLDPRIEYDER